MTHEHSRDCYRLPAGGDSINRAVWGLSGEKEELLFELMDLYLQVCLWSCGGSESRPRILLLGGLSCGCLRRIRACVAFPEMFFVLLFDCSRGAVPLMLCCKDAFLGDARSSHTHTERRRSPEPPWLQTGKCLVQSEVEAQRPAYKAASWLHRCTYKENAECIELHSNADLDSFF